ncbi:MAG: molybdopterin-binding protein [Nitrospirae bacterium]|nr:molybdopterin-binding protein [Nitrospirota bacterium]
MCDSQDIRSINLKTIPLQEAVGTVLAHDITEIRTDEFKGCAFKKGHVIRKEDICHLQRLGKEHLFVLNIAEGEMHEDEAAYALADALIGEGVEIHGEPREGKINIIAERDGLLKIDRNVLLEFNMLGDVMCATLHDNTVVRKGQVVAGTRAIPLVVKRAVVEEAVMIATQARKKQSKVTPSLTLPPRGGGQGRGGIIEVKEIRKLKAGIVITGNEVYYGKIKDAFAPVISKKIEEFNGEIVGIYYAPDDKAFIEARLRELIEAGADLLITTGGMSVDPDDVTRFAILKLGAADITYGSAALPGAMFLVAYIYRQGNRETETQGRGDSEITEDLNLSASPSHRVSKSIVPILGIPACGMYHKITVFDIILPRILAGEKISRKDLAELGHGGLCLGCSECRYPACPFGKT